MSGGGGCEAQSGQQWVGGRSEGWTWSCNNFEQAVRPRYIQEIVDSSLDGGENEAALELLGGVTCYYWGWPVEGAPGTHIVPAVESQPSTRADV